MSCSGARKTRQGSQGSAKSSHQLVTSRDTAEVRGLGRRVGGEEERLPESIGHQVVSEELEVGGVPGFVVVPEVTVFVLHLRGKEKQPLQCFER